MPALLLLLPVALSVGYWFAHSDATRGAAKVPFPMFALGFLLLCMVNSAVPSISCLAALYTPVKALLLDCSFWGLMIAIGALGLGTSLKSISALGWRHIATVSATTVVILVLVTASLLAVR